jgi:hypothetical protein
MVFNLGDRRKWNFDYLTIRAFDLYAGSCEGLSGFHAANDAPHSMAVKRYNLNVIFAVQRLQGRECLCDFHVMVSSKVHSRARR